MSVVPQKRSTCHPLVCGLMRELSQHAVDVRQAHPPDGIAAPAAFDRRPDGIEPRRAEPRGVLAPGADAAMEAHGSLKLVEMRERRDTRVDLHPPQRQRRAQNKSRMDMPPT
jgi:hypothetical protein